VVGASRKPLSIGYRILEGLVRNNFAGPIYPVNPAAEELLGRRVYARVDEIADAVDLAVIVVPSKRVMEVVDQCALKQVRALVVISAGFAEVGEEGRALQRQLAEKVRLGGMRMVGPNCLGVLNTHPAVRMNASFAPVFPPAGGVAMLSQSGALGIAVLALAGQKHMGMSSFVSVGNKADVSGNDLLQYWEQDPDTKVILLYLESFGNPRRFARVARRVSLSKPVIAVKGGRTSAGKRAAGSHTAALAASDVAVDALFEQTGVIRVNTLAEMFDLSVVLAEQSLPKGNRVAIVTNAGGPGILCADACETSGLAVPQLSEAVRRKLASYLPPEAGMVNPVDMIAGATPENYSRAVGDILQSDDVDALIALYVPVGVTNTPEIAEGIAAGVRQVRAAGIRKPILACLMDTAGHGASLRVDQERIPTHTFPEEAARSLGKAVEYAQWRQRPQGVVLDFIDTDVEQARAVVQRELAQHGEGWLSTPGAWEVLRAVGLPVAKGGIASSAQGAAAIARAIGFPVVVKLASQKIVHKTEHGAVVLNLKDEAAVVRAFEAIQQRLVQAGQADAMDGVLVQPMLSGGIEVMVGMFEDPSFGPLIAFGLGGVHVEILRDVSFRITPLTDLDAEHMIRDIKGAQLFEGYRGHAPADTDALKELLLRISLLVEAVPEIAELDLNPVFALEPGKGCHIVDVRIRVKAPNKQGASRYSHLMTG
jgi:acetyl coenzyme A synthetase (ADP forming)-like protein